MIAGHRKVARIHLFQRHIVENSEVLRLRTFENVNAANSKRVSV